MNALTPRQRTLAAANYEDYRDLITALCHRFCQRFGGHVDDMIADASTLFIKATITPMRATTTSRESHYKRWIWNGLLDKRRTEITRAQRYQYAELSTLATKPYRPLEDIFTTDISRDADYVVQLSTDPPKELAETIISRGGEPRNYRSCIRAYLTDQGWDRDRINAAFSEIAAAL